MRMSATPPACGDRSVPAWFELYVGPESTAHRLREHDDTLIPEFLQTRDYAYGSTGTAAADLHRHPMVPDSVGCTSHARQRLRDRR